MSTTEHEKTRTRWRRTARAPARGTYGALSVRVWKWGMGYRYEREGEKGWNHQVEDGEGVYASTAGHARAHKRLAAHTRLARGAHM